jgi:alkylation response protein AidB-like acyl-CoA dehydrogenase
MSNVFLQALRREVRRFLEAQLEAGAFAAGADAWMAGIDPSFSRELGRRGWVGMTFPATYGGHGRSALERFVVTEELLAAGAPVAAHWIADRQIGPSLLRHGSEEQKRRYLPGIARGELFFCLGMSEPDAGSDLAAVRTTAKEADGGWVLNGTKVWTTHAQFAHGIVVLARTASADGDRHAGLSQFIVDLPHPEVAVRPIRSLDGGAHFNEVVFVDARVPATALLGTAGEAWRQVTSELAYERSGPERILTTMPLLLAWSERLRQHNGPDAAAVGELGRLTARLQALRALSFEVAVALDAGRVPDAEAAMVKDLGTRFEQELSEAISRFSAVEPDFDSADPFAVLLAQAVSHAPTFTIRGGTNDILRGIVAKRIGVR